MDLSKLNEIKDPVKLDEELVKLLEADMAKRISVEVKAKSKQQEKKKPAAKKTAKK